MWLTAAANGGTSVPAPTAGQGKDLGDLINEGAQIVPRIAEAAAVLLVSALVLIALIALVVVMWRRAMKASLAVRPFLDGAVGVKVGPGLASMVEERLVGALRRKDWVEDGYDLDRVAIDIELLTEDNDLAKAMERLADVPQLKHVVAVMNLTERLLPSRGLSAAGELLPAGRDGVGVSLALYQGSRLTSRSSLWGDEVKLWLPDERDGAQTEVSEPVSSENDEADPSDPAPHYRLAAPAAWWVQYEAARVLDQNVSLITNSAPSFALVGIGLAREREGELPAAEEIYASALEHDPDNVAALFNLAQLLAKEHALYLAAALLLVRAEESLTDRHAQGMAATSRGEESQLLDPTWYRVRYALAVRCMQVAYTDAAGVSRWPKGMTRKKGARWQRSFGPKGQKLLRRLFADQKSTRSLLEDPAAAAIERAEALLYASAAVLDEAGWHWVGRRPPRYLIWSKRLSSRLRRLVLRWRKERPVAGEAELIRFLSDVVEPATAILYCSTWLIQGDSGDGYESLEEAVLGRAGAEVEPVDRRSLASMGARSWALDYLGTFLMDQRIDTAFKAKVEARLGRTQYRAPSSPTPRARYSLACLLSRLAVVANQRGEEEAKESFLSGSVAQLDRAFSDAFSSRRDRLSRWAHRDPDLDGLRKHYASSFEAIVARWGPAERRPLTRAETLESSAISTAGYDEEAKVLELKLADGSCYQYLDVPEEIYEELVEAKSPGSFFNEEIVPKFTFIRI